MKLFDSKLMNRLALGKAIGFAVGLVAFFMIPLVFSDADLMLRLAVLFWYTTLGALVGIFGVWDHYPIFDLKVPYWFRGVWLGAWMNFVLALFMYDKLTLLMQGTFLEGYSVFWIVLEGAIIGLIVDCITTKTIGEGKELLK